LAKVIKRLTKQEQKRSSSASFGATSTGIQESKHHLTQQKSRVDNLELMTL